MSNRRKSFKAGKSLDSYEPVEFDLNDKTFKCKSALQGAVLLEFVSKADSDRGGEAAGALYGLFEDCMDAEEYERFREYLNSPDIIFEMDEIGEIASWLIEEYTSRPTKQPEPSGTGQLSPGPTSTEQPSFVA